jgi:hypothetical protein
MAKDSTITSAGLNPYLSRWDIEAHKVRVQDIVLTVKDNGVTISTH